MCIVGDLLFEDKKFQGFCGCLQNLNNIYPQNYIAIAILKNHAMVATLPY